MDIITKQLEQQRKIKVIEIKVEDEESGIIIFAKDADQEYTIKIISIAKNNNNDKEICQQKLNEAKIDAANLKSCDHQNIAKYRGEFQIEANYFILMERFEMSLQDWVEKQKQKKQISQQLFIKFALGLLHAVDFIHSKDFVLKDLSLRNIYLDKDYNIKICDFGCAKEIIPSQQTQKFLAQKAQDIRFYLPPEYYDHSSKNNSRSQQVYQQKDGDTWVAGVCLYQIAGNKFLFIKRLTNGEGFHANQLKLEKGINNILQNIFWLNPKLRPSITDLIKSFQSYQYQDNLISQDQLTLEEYDLTFIDTFNKGFEYYNNEQFDEAIELFKEASKLNSSSYEALFFLGVCYAERSMHDQANSYYIQAINLQPENCLAFKNLGQSQLKQQKFEESLINLKKSIELNLEYSHAYNLLALCYHELKNYKEAEMNYKLSSKFTPQQAIPQFNLGNLYGDQQLYEDSILYYKKAIEINPYFTHAYYNIGNVHYEMNELDSALANYKHAIEIDPYKSSAYNNLGNVYQEQNNLEQALDCFKKLKKIDINHEFVNYNLAYTYSLKSMKTFAILNYKLMLKINPGYIYTYENLGNEYYNDKNFEKAIKSYQKGLKIQKDEYVLGLVDQSKSLI